MLRAIGKLLNSGSQRDFCCPFVGNKLRISIFQRRDVRFLPVATKHRHEEIAWVSRRWKMEELFGAVVSIDMPLLRSCGSIKLPRVVARLARRGRWLARTSLWNGGARCQNRHPPAARPH